MAMTCSVCGGCQRKKLVEDEPGSHTYILACETCHREEGIEWTEYHMDNFAIHLINSNIQVLNVGPIMGDVQSSHFSPDARPSNPAKALHALATAIGRSRLPAPTQQAAIELVAALREELTRPQGPPRGAVLRAVAAHLWTLVRTASEVTVAYEGLKVALRLTAGIDLP